MTFPEDSQKSQSNKNLHNRIKVSQEPRGRIYTLLNASENIM